MEEQRQVTPLREITGGDKLKMLSLLLFWFALFIPIYPAMVQEWLANSDNSHGFIVPFATGYFVWDRRNRLGAVTPEDSWWGCLMLVVVLLIYVLSFAGGLAFPARVAMVLSLFGLLWCMLGNATIRILAFPILFLLFMIPVPYSLINLVSGPLQLFATKISAALIAAFTIPVFRDGNMLYFVSTQLEVAEACSGIRSIIALSMLAVGFASMSQTGWLGRAILILMAIPIALAANVIRVTGTGILAHFFGDKVARGFLHEFSGIAIFVLGFAALFAVFTLINRKMAKNVK